MTELLITSKVPGKLILWRFPGPTTENSTGQYYQHYGDYMAQTFKAKDRRLYKIEVYLRAVYADTTISVELWSLSDPDDPTSDPEICLETLASKTYSAVQTDFWETFEFDMEKVMQIGKYYAIVFHSSDAYIYYSGDAFDGIFQYSDDGTTWTKYTSGEDLTVKLHFGSKTMQIEDYGYSEAYILRIEYLENGTQVILDDEINLYGDAGDVDDLPTAILIPFKKAERISGSMKFYGVGVP